MENKFVWIENIKSFSGRHRLRGDGAVGSSLWYPDFFEESQKLSLVKPSEKVYHLLNMERLLGSSVVSSECARQKYKTKAQKRVAYLESMARGVKVCAKDDLSQTINATLSGYKKLNEQFYLDRLLTLKTTTKELVSVGRKDELDSLLLELAKGDALIRISFSLWLYVVSIRSSVI